MKLPDDVAAAVAPVFELLPLTEAMPTLVVADGKPGHAAAHPALCSAIEAAIATPALRARPVLAAALWLYADELDRSHTISQGIETPTGSYWHGIMHRREGDFSNSKYWFRRTGNHQAMARVPTNAYDPYKLVEDADHAYHAGDNTRPAVVDQQRAEWQTLFTWCAER